MDPGRPGEDLVCAAVPIRVAGIDPSEAGAVEKSSRTHLLSDLQWAGDGEGRASPGSGADEGINPRIGGRRHSGGGCDGRRGDFRPSQGVQGRRNWGSGAADRGKNHPGIWQRLVARMLGHPVSLEIASGPFMAQRGVATDLRGRFGEWAIQQIAEIGSQKSR